MTTINPTILASRPVAAGFFSALGWERQPLSQLEMALELETEYVLKNRSLMEQIERSQKTHEEGTGRRLSPEELDALDRA